MNATKTKTVQEIAEIIGGELLGDGSLIVHGVNNISSAVEGELTFAENPINVKKALNSSASAVIAPKDTPQNCKPLITVTNPKFSFAKVIQIFLPATKPSIGIDPKVEISPKAILGKDISIGPFTVVEEGAVIKDGAIIQSNCYIGKNVVIGENTWLFPNVVILERVQIGREVIIQSGTTIGGEGFGYSFHENRFHKIPQTGTVILKDYVEVGVNCSIDRATFGVTQIGEGSKIDCLVQIGHNCTIGKHCIICSQVGISGSSKIGDYVMLGGQAGLSDKVTVGNQVKIGAQSGLASGKKIRDGEIIFGSPAKPLKDVKKQFAGIRRLPKMMKDFKEMKEKISELEKKLTKP